MYNLIKREQRFKLLSGSLFGIWNIQVFVKLTVCIIIFEKYQHSYFLIISLPMTAFLIVNRNLRYD